MNLRPPGYEPDELPTALLRDIQIAPTSFPECLYSIARLYPLVKGFARCFLNFLIAVTERRDGKRNRKKRLPFPALCAILPIKCKRPGF